MIMKRTAILFTFLGLLCACSSRTSADGVDDIVPVPQFGKGIAEVETKYGTVAGYIEDGTYIYKGIRYAKAERFMPPEEPDNWEGVLSTREYGPTCPQGHHGIGSDVDEFTFSWTDGVFDEDCLRLNIWTQGIGDDAKRPVLFWIHGGGYAAGSGQQLPAYDGRNLSKRGDVVVVTVNHRLNMLGFLDLSSFGERYRYSGNVGLMDLVAALKWIHENIARFGGDPSNVMIMGQSGGGGKVSHLLTMPSAKGLFHKACIQSGSSIQSGNPAQSAELGRQFVKASGLTPAELETVSYERLAEIAGKLGGVMKYAPHVDGEVIPVQLSDALSDGASKDIPIIIGSNFNEFSVSPSNAGLTLGAARTALEKMYGDKTDEYISLFEKAYPGMEPRDYIELDTWARPSALSQAALKAAQGGAPVYVYQFMFFSPAFEGLYRCPHNLEIPFFFDNVARQYALTGGTPGAQRLGHAMSDLWISFARDGVPSSDALPAWSPYSMDEPYTLQLRETESRLVNGHDTELLAFLRDYAPSLPIFK